MRGKAGSPLIIIGAVLSSIGVAGILCGFLGIGWFVAQVSTLSADQTTLCDAGERLVEEQGPSEYTPGQGYGRSTQYYCEDEQGNRRDVTGAFVEGLLGTMLSSSLTMVTSLAVQGISFTLLLIGLILAGIGLLLRYRARATSRGAPPH